MASSNTTIVRPDSAKLKALGDWALAEIKSGSSPIVVADAVTAKYPGVSMHDIFPKGDLGKRPKSLTDMARSVLQGLTMGSADEGAGAIGAMTGGDYSTVRDAFRADDARFQQQHAGTDAALRMTGAAIPAAAMAMIPGMQPQAGAFLANAARGAIGGGVLGAATGAGESTAPTMGGVAGDAAKSGAIGAVTGGVVGGAISPRAPAATLTETATAGAAFRPGDVSLVNRAPVDMKSVVRSRAELLPDVVVPADADPTIQQTLLGVIGADAKIASRARSEAMRRILTIRDKTKELKGAVRRMDKQLLNLLDESLDESPSAVAQIAKKRTYIEQVRDGVRDQIAMLDDWEKSARATHDGIQSSIEAFSQKTLTGKRPPTITVQIPLRPSVGAVGTAMTQTVKQALGGGPTPAQNAQALYNLLLNPGTAEDVANRIGVLQVIGLPTRSPMGGMVPAGAATAMIQRP